MNLGEDKTAQVITNESQSGPNAEEAERERVVAYIEQRIELLSKETKHTYVALTHELRLFVGDLRAGKHLPPIARGTK